MDFLHVQYKDFMPLLALQDNMLKKNIFKTAPLHFVILSFIDMKVSNKNIKLPSKMEKPDWLQIDADPNPDYNFDAHPDPDFYFMQIRMWIWIRIFI